MACKDNITSQIYFCKKRRKKKTFYDKDNRSLGNRAGILRFLFSLRESVNSYNLFMNAKCQAD